jgi:hypothetical protein
MSATPSCLHDIQDVNRIAAMEAEFAFREAVFDRSEPLQMMNKHRRHDSYQIANRENGGRMRKFHADEDQDHETCCSHRISSCRAGPGARPAHMHHPAGRGHTPSYAGEESRDIKSLLEEDIAVLRRGGGWGSPSRPSSTASPAPRICSS